MIEPLYVAARGVLLDALDALGEQREALILAGAQAIYIHTGAADLAVAEFTTDGDLVVNPEQLKTQPRLSEAMERAHFRSGVQPGSWLRDRTVSGIATAIPVDLLVPEAVAGPGRRAARLGDHGDRAGRRVRGLEGALIDHSVMRLKALDEDDRREFEVRVAGPSGLLVAKLHKLVDRSGEREAKRLKDKDALDVFRLLRAIPVEPLARGLRELGDSTLAGDVTRAAIEHLQALFGATSSPGTVMVVRATERIEDPNVMAASCVALADDLIRALR
ncbi:MAG: hypothetical protein WD227_13035 [Vicinamibacterales bacterium]